MVTMDQAIEEKNKELVLTALDTLFNKRETKRSVAAN
jgi:hypothetical protein